MEDRVSRWEWITLGILAISTVAACIGFPLIAFRLVDPFILEVFGKTVIVDPFSVYMILFMMVGLLILLPLGLFFFGFVNKGYKRVGTYLGGANIDDVTFEGAMESSQTIELKNYYLEKFFGENVLFNAGVFISLILLVIMFGVAII
jgi:ech hydrogenase subunit A